MWQKELKVRIGSGPVATFRLVLSDSDVDGGKPKIPGGGSNSDGHQLQMRRTNGKVSSHGVSGGRGYKPCGYEGLS